MSFSRLLVALLILQLSVGVLAQQEPVPNKPAAPPTAAPQQPTNRSDEDDVVRITTNLVQVDAVITDSKGRLVTDLRPEELDIREDGKSQPITHLSFVELESKEVIRQPANPIDKTSPPIPPVRLRPEEVHRTIALVVDDLGLSFESTYFVREALKKFLDKQMQPNDLVAIIRTSGGVGALQQFTSDKRVLYAAADKVKWNPQGRGNIYAFAPIAGDPLAVRAKDDATIARNVDQDLEQFREDVFSVGTLGALNHVVRGLNQLPGRKSILLISDGLPITNRSDPARNIRVIGRLRSLIDLANRSAVVIYTLDARGLPILELTASDNTSSMIAEEVERSLSNRRSTFFDSQEGLIYLADATGGFAVRNNNDINAGIRRVIDDQKGYYLIGYRPDETTFEKILGRRKYHKLSLKVNRPGKFNVRMRSGFFGITDAERVATGLTPVQQLISALLSPFGSSGVNLRLTSLYASDPKLGSIMRSYLHINGRDLTFTPEADGWHKTVFDILAFTFGDNGVVVDQLSRKQTMRVRGPVYQRLMKEGFTYHLTVPIKKPGAYQLRTAIRDDASGRVGAASQFIDVPDIKKNRMVVSGILVRGTTLEMFNKKMASGWTEQKGDGASSDDVSTPIDAGVAVRRFKRGLVMEYGLSIYNAQLDSSGKPQVQTQVRLFRNGQQVFAGETKQIDSQNQPDLKRLVVGGAMQLGSEMAPGEYVLQVIATDPLAKGKHRMATQWIDFEIVN